MVKGGRENRCTPKGWEETFGKVLGRECPRVELPFDLTPEVEILEFLLLDRLKPLAARRAELVCSVYGMSLEEENETLSRVCAILTNPDVRAITDPSPEVPRG